MGSQPARGLKIFIQSNLEHKCRQSSKYSYLQALYIIWQVSSTEKKRRPSSVKYSYVQASWKLWFFTFTGQDAKYGPYQRCIRSAPSQLVKWQMGCFWTSSMVYSTIVSDLHLLEELTYSKVQTRQLNVWEETWKEMQVQIFDDFQPKLWQFVTA